MKIKSVTVNTVVEINGGQFIIKSSDLTESIRQAKRDGQKMDLPQDIISWVLDNDLDKLFMQT